MPSIEKRGKNTWRLTVELGTGPNGERLRERKTIKIEDKALLKTTKKLREHLEEEWLKFKMEVESGAYIKPEKITFKEFVDKHWRPKHAFDPEVLAPSTLAIYEEYLKNHIMPWFGHMEMSEITNSHVSDFKAYLRTPEARKDGKPGPLGNGTQRYILRVLRHIFVYAHEERKIIKSNPCNGIRWPEKPETNVVVYEEEEIEAIIDALYQEPIVWRLLILGTFLGGFRRGEVVALEVGDCDFGDNSIMVDENIPMKINREYLIKAPKNRTSLRKVVMPEWYMNELKMYIDEIWRPQREEFSSMWKAPEGREFLFHKGDGLPFHPNTLTRWWRDFLKRHGFRHIKLHGLRHTSATYLLEQPDVTMRAVAERLGHKNEKTLMTVYSHKTKKMERRAASKFDRFARRSPDMDNRPQNVPNYIFGTSNPTQETLLH